ncbi:MAG: undecaprenyl-diphosphate phosphatase [Anaerolineales bacterium]
MTFFQALFFGLLQGLTEFLPISSTAHLLLAQNLFRLPADEVMFAFLVLVQWGTVLALLVYFWRDWWDLLRAFFARPFSTPQNRMVWYILIGTLPALLAGALLHDAVKMLFSQPLLEAGIRLWMTAILLTLAEVLGKRQRQLESLRAGDALWIGAFQVLAVFPGASRSGSTLSGGLLRGFDRPSATRFAFLLAFPVMVAAGVFELLGMIGQPLPSTFLPTLLTGMLTAALSGWLAIHWLLRYVQKHSLWTFVFYCAVIGSLAFGLYFRS